jgi:hypothetical protein
MSYGIISAEHFWYKTDGEELYAIINSCRYIDYQKWLHTRQVCYVIAQVNSKKRINIDNFMKLTNPLETAVKVSEDINIEEFKQMERQYEDFKNKRGGSVKKN